VLVLHVANALEDAAADRVAQVLGRRLRVDIAEVHGAVHGLAPGRVNTEGRERAERARERVCARRRDRGLRHKRLRGRNLGGLCGGLLALRDVRASVLAVVDALAGPLRLRRERVHDLGGGGDAEEVDEADVLVADDLDLVDEPEAGEVVAELLLGHALVESAEVDVPAGVALADRECDLLRHGRGLAPADLELLAVKRELLDRCVRVELRGGRAVEEAQEHTRLFRKDADVLERAEVHQVEELVDRRRRREASDVHSPVGRVCGGRVECSRKSARRVVSCGGDVERRELREAVSTGPSSTKGAHTPDGANAPADMG
jgi:hypothetical protein